MARRRFLPRVHKMTITPPSCRLLSQCLWGSVQLTAFTRLHPGMTHLLTKARLPLWRHPVTLSTKDDIAPIKRASAARWEMSPVASSGDDNRPDGRTTTSETEALRVATRALREHLDELPVDYNLNMPGDRFLAGLAFMFARQRYDCADSMIGAGFGGTVLGFMARSLFVDGLRWLWIGQDPERRRSLLGDLLKERNHLCIQFEISQLFSRSCPDGLCRYLTSRT